MTITIDLSPQTEAKLRQQAAESGLPVAIYLRDVIERQVLGTHGGSVGSDPSALASFPSDAALAAFRKDVAESGMTDEELHDLFETVRGKAYREKHGLPSKAP